MKPKNLKAVWQNLDSSQRKLLASYCDSNVRYLMMVFCGHKTASQVLCVKICTYLYQNHEMSVTPYDFFPEIYNSNCFPDGCFGETA